MASVLRSELALIAGVITAVIFFTVGSAWLADLTNLPLSGAMFVWLFMVMMWCAFGVVHHGEALAALLGEPYGTPVLTISVISIEVTIMAIVMFSGDPNPTLPRETMFAILMIVLNGMVGLALVIGAVRYGQQRYNLKGAIAFLAVITPLSVIALVLPEFVHSTADRSFTPLQAKVFAILTVLLYGAFLAIQTVRHRPFFVEPTQGAAPETEGSDGQLRDHEHSAIRSVPYHAIFLVLTLLPVVLLSKPLATLLDYGIEKAGAPTPLGGIFIAILILSPEGLAALQAAARNELQRCVNLCLGSAVATIGLTVPVVLTISVVTGNPLMLGIDNVEMVLLALTLFVGHMTFSGAPTNLLLGLVHLVLFSAYIVLVFNP